MSDGAVSAEPQDLREAHIELVQPLAVHRSRLDDIYRDIGGAARKWAAERRCHEGIGGDEVGEDLGSRDALERSADLEVDARDRVRAEHLHLREEVRVHAAIIL